MRASIPGDPADFNALIKELSSDFPHQEEKRKVQGEIGLRGDESDKSWEPHIISAEISFMGVRVANPDETIFLHLSPTGFTFNNVKGYIGGSDLIDKALMHWKWLVERAKPESVSRVALKYINRLTLPIQPHEDLEKYFCLPPHLPAGSPQAVSEYLSRIVSRDDERDAIADVTQQLKPQYEQGKPFTFSIALETYQIGTFPVDAEALRKILGSLREFKNEVFFSLLTDETVSVYE